MLCSGRIITCSSPQVKPSAAPRGWRARPPAFLRWRSMAAGGSAAGGDPDAAAASSLFASSADPSTATAGDSPEKNPAVFCIIEGPETVQDFAKMELQEIQDNIRSRRNKIFLHMEEVRRLRIQQRIKSAELGILDVKQENELPDFPSFIPFLPPLTPANLKMYYASCFSLIAGIIIFGGLLAPTLELKLGLGGTSYADFIRSVHLPMQLSQVDPIVASFSGGAVGVISALMVVEINNVKQQEHKRCKYCLGTGTNIIENHALLCLVLWHFTLVRLGLLVTLRLLLNIFSLFSGVLTPNNFSIACIMDARQGGHVSKANSTHSGNTEESSLDMCCDVWSPEHFPKI